MKQVLLAFALLFTLSTASAAVEVNTSGLTDSQKAELVKQAESMKENARANSVEGIADNTEKWLNIGERVGKMLGGAAREVGIAANEFLQTPVGQMTAAVIVFQYMGGPIIHMFTGIAVLFLGVAVIYFLSRQRRTLTVKYDTTKTNVFGNHPVIAKERGRMDDDTFGWSIALYVATVATATVVFLTF